MLIKFLEHGTGSGRKAAAYLTGEKDHNGDVRPLVKVLRGDPWIVAEVADSLNFKNRYTSGVIAFEPGDKPTDEQIDAVLDDFEKLAFAGIGAGRASYSAILHGEIGGGVHIHILAARVDLESGKSMNVAPPGWQKNYGHLQDYHNKTHGWGDPNDPARARTLRPGKRALIEASAVRMGLKIEPDTKKVVTEFLEQRIEHGLVKNRADVVQSLIELGFEVTRQGRDYISVKDPENGSKYRFKGVLYDINFDTSKPYLGALESRPECFRDAFKRSAEESRECFDAAVEKLSDYNKKYYAKRVRESNTRTGFVVLIN